MRKFDNYVYILGGDHHNTLAAIRCFGQGNYNIKIGVLSDAAKKIVGSKYAKARVKELHNEKEIVNWLHEEGRTLSQKAFIIPCSDMAEYVVDTYYNTLSQFYFLPGFYRQCGRVASLMDKYEQKKLAEQYSIRMADTWQIDLAGVDLDEICFPCIVKPEISAFGSKTDIRTFGSMDELDKALDRYRENGYKVLLCQQFLKKKYEVCAYGYISQEVGKTHNGIIIKKIRENKGGSTAFAKIVNDAALNEEVDKLCNLLQQDGYTGLYDFEYFVCDDGIYLNEINFRQSGNEYAAVNLGYPSALNWACSVLDFAVDDYPSFTGEYHMDDVGELAAVKHGNLTLLGFMKDIIKARNCAVLNLRDLRGTISYYKSML